MSILIIGGDQISQISSMLTQMGAKTINHWDARKKSSAPKKKVPQDTDCIVMLTSFLNHNTMLKYKNEAKKEIFHLFVLKDQYLVYMMNM